MSKNNMFTDKLCSLLEQKRTLKPLPRRIMRVFTSTYQFDDTGKPIKGSNFVEYNVAERLKNLKASDFSIPALQAVGADLRLTTFSMDSYSLTSDIISKTEKFISSQTVKSE